MADIYIANMIYELMNEVKMRHSANPFILPQLLRAIKYNLYCSKQAYSQTECAWRSYWAVKRHLKEMKKKRHFCTFCIFCQ